MQGENAVLNVVTLPPGATSTQARLVMDGVRGAIFLYQNGGPVGALVGSWAISAGTDPYGNPYPQGFQVSVGVISGGTITGVSITASTITGTTFDGTDFVINSSGAFFYSGTPAAGNLIASITAASGVDPHGNKYAAGVNAYVVIGGLTMAVGLNSVGATGGYPGLSINDVNTPGTQPAGLFGQASNSATPQAIAVMTSGQEGATDVGANFQLNSKAASGIARGEAIATCDLFDVNGALEIDSPSVIPAMATGFGALLYTDLTNATPLRMQNATDGLTYAVGKKTLYTAPNTLINSLTATTLQTMNVIAGPTYHIRVVSTYTENAAAGAPVFSFSGTAGFGHTDGYNEWTHDGSGIVSSGFAIGTMFGNMTGPTFTGSGTNDKLVVELWIVFTSSGTFTFRAQCSVATDTFNVKAVICEQEVI